MKIMNKNSNSSKEKKKEIINYKKQLSLFEGISLLEQLN